MKDIVFVIRISGQEVWKAKVNDFIVPADFNSKGAALAGIEVEKRRQANQRKQHHENH